MANLVEIEGILTFSFLGLAAAIFLWQTIQLRRDGASVTGSFPGYLLLMLVGWATTEMIADYSGGLLGRIGEVAHLFVMALFAVIITIHWKRSTHA